MHNAPQANPSIAVVIHCYKVTRHVVDVLRRIGPEVTRIYLIDDGCPEASGDHASRHCSDPRLRIVQHATNQGVGGAVMSGYSAAINDGMDIIVKIDGDGQMDPALIAEFTGPKAEPTMQKATVSSSSTIFVQCPPCGSSATRRFHS